MDIEKNIDELAVIINKSVYFDCCSHQIKGALDAGEAINAAGYRKASEVKEEVIAEIFSELFAYCNADFLLGLPNPNKGLLTDKMLKLIAEKHGFKPEGK